VAYFCAITATFSQNTVKRIEKELRSEFGFKIWLQGKSGEMENYVVSTADLYPFLVEHKLEYLNGIPDFFNWYTGTVETNGNYVYYEAGVVNFTVNNKPVFKRLNKKQIKELFKTNLN
jgi:hypothetical protein